MMIFLLLCLVSSISASTVIPTDSQTFFTGETKPTHVPGFGATIDNPKSSDLTVIPVDSQTFFNSEPEPPHVKTISVTVKHPKPSGLTAVHIDTQTFFNHKPISPLLDSTIRHPKPSDTNVIPIDSQTFFVSEPEPPKSSDTNVIPIDSQNFFVGEPEPPKSSDINVMPVDSQTFFVGEPEPPKSSDINVMPVDSQTFFVGEPEPPKSSDINVMPVDSQTFFVGEPEPPKSSDINVIPVDSQTFFSGEPEPPHLDATVPPSKSPKYKDSASYCSVYLKKEKLKKGAIVCPLFAAPSPTQESSVRSNCEHESQEKEFKFCSSSYKDISKKVTGKLGKNKLVSSAAPEMNISTIAEIKNIAAFGQAVICHKAQYVGFYCHQLGKSSVFALKLSDLNGDRLKYANMLAVCHDDTSSWNRNRLVFKILNGKPGDAICHLLPSYDLVWVALR
ncbi:uncharacterized protein LOC141587352 [Silene latifolia]|uniref:uncharacterized protein LOC141587352 n=1 Tax=Silene latifolia TaxID=37657 RepID=UPI003D779C9B